jgi:2-hydroxychromene-2-carboxylate isomerase
MPVNVELHFDFGSPNAYLRHLVVPAIEGRTGVRFAYVPVLLGGVFKVTANVSPAVSLRGIKNKGEYAELDTRRSLAQHGITNYTPNPFFPMNTLQIMRGAVAAQCIDCYARYVDEVYRHMWADPKNMADPLLIEAALMESGLPAAELLAPTGPIAHRAHILQLGALLDPRVQFTPQGLERGGVREGRAEIGPLVENPLARWMGPHPLDVGEDFRAGCQELDTRDLLGAALRNRVHEPTGSRQQRAGDVSLV